MVKWTVRHCITQRLYRISKQLFPRHDTQKNEEVLRGKKRKSAGSCPAQGSIANPNQIQDSECALFKENPWGGNRHDAVNVINSYSKM